MTKRFRWLCLTGALILTLCLVYTSSRPHASTSSATPGKASQAPASPAASTGSDQAPSVQPLTSEQYRRAERKLMASVRAIQAREAQHLERRKQELKLMPTRTSEPIRHQIVKTTTHNLQKLPAFATGHYEKCDQLTIHDFRESVRTPHVIANPKLVSIIRREWLLTDVPEGYPIKREEELEAYEDGTEKLIAENEYVADNFVVLVDVKHSLVDFKAKAESLGFTVREVLISTPKGHSHVVLTSSEATLDSFRQGRQELLDTGFCTLVEKNGIRHVSRTPNDPYYPNFTLNYSSFNGQVKDYSVIKMPAAWDVTTGSSSFLVSVVDTGVLGWHSDLKDNMWHNPAHPDPDGYNWGVKAYDGQKVFTGQSLWDQNGHGTHCAGLIGARGNNDHGITGVNWNVKIIGCCVSLGNSGSLSIVDATWCWQWSAEQGAKVISNSWGGFGISSYERTAAAAMQRQGVILSCAAGNESTNTDAIPSGPASLAMELDNVVSVAATDRDQGLANFSNYGVDTVTIAAPGQSILSTIPYWEGNTVSEDYTWLSGTSMATPIVSGAIALIWSQYPEETYKQILNRLYDKSTKLSILNGKVKGARFLNVANAIAMNGITPPTGLKASQGTYPNRILISCNAAGNATHYRLLYSTSANGTKRALGTFQTQRSWTHSSNLKKDQIYYYWVQAASSASGRNASGYSASATGWLSNPKNRIDQWDPEDDAMEKATVFRVNTSKTTTPQHGIIGDTNDTEYEKDQQDWFQFTVSPQQVGKMMHFQSTIKDGSAFKTKDLVGVISDSEGNMLGYNDDIVPDSDEPYDGTYDFKVSFIPHKSGTFHLLVRGFDSTKTTFYTVTSWVGDDDPVMEDRHVNLDHTADSYVLKLNSQEKGFWTIYPKNRPAWITDLIFTYPNGAVERLSGDAIRQFIFEGKATLTLKASANTSPQERFWRDMLVIPSHTYRICVTQKGGALMPPDNIKASQGTYNDRVLVSWNPVQGASYYRLFRADTQDGTPETIPGLNWSTSTKQYDATATPGQKYFYAVKAATTISGQVTSGFSSTAMGFAGKQQDQQYKLTVVKGTGSRSCPKGTITTIAAEKAPLGKKFSKWTGDVSAVKDTLASTTTLTMPAQNVTVTATYVDELDNLIAPFPGEVEECPINPFMSVYVIVTIDGHRPADTDWISAYCGENKRCETQLKGASAGRPVKLNINWKDTTEIIRFKVFDSATKKTLMAPSVSIYPSRSNPYTRLNPLIIEVGYVESPYGEPIAHPKFPSVKAYVSSTIFGKPCDTGDFVAAYCGNELRAVARVTSGEPVTMLKINRAKDTGEDIIFRIFDIDALNDQGEQTGREFDATLSCFRDGAYQDPITTYTTDGQDLGDKTHPVKLIVSDDKKQTLTLNKDWTAFALNLKRPDTTLQGLWGDKLSLVREIQTPHDPNIGYNTEPGREEDTLTDIEHAKQYWVKMAQQTTLPLEGKLLNLKDFSFTLRGKGRISILPYIPQHTSKADQTFAKILNDETFKLLKIESSSGGILYPSNAGKTSTLTVLKPNDVYWVFSTEDSGDMAFTYTQPSTNSIHASRAWLANQESLPKHWTKGNPWSDNPGTGFVPYNLHLTYFGESINANSDMLQVAAFVMDEDGQKQRISNPNHSHLKFGQESYIPLELNGALSENFTVFFEVFDRGNPESNLPGEENPRRLNETFTVAELKQDKLFQVSAGTAAPEDAPTYTITFDLNSNSNMETAILLPGQDQSILTQKLPRNASYKDIILPRICTNIPGMTCHFQISTDNIRKSATYRPIFISLLFDLDLSGNGQIEVDEVAACNGLIFLPYGLTEQEGRRAFAVYTDPQDPARNTNGRPHSIDTNQDWIIDPGEMTIANGFLFLYYSKESTRTPTQDLEHGYGTGFKVKDNQE